MREQVRLGLSSNEKKEQNIMLLRKYYRTKEVVTVESAKRKFGNTESTIIRWAKEGDIPLVHGNKTVVPLTEKNMPNWL